jgi:hypothetical protein
MKDLKKTTQQYVSLDGQKSGCSMSFMGIGCAAVFMLIVMMCGGGIYGLFYSSLPLKAIEAALEQNGDVEIEGLTGNLTTGFAIDEIRFKSELDPEKWSNLKDIKFKYANNRSWLGSDRLIIEELSVDGGTIYAQWDPEQNELDLDPEFEDKLSDIDEDFEQAHDDIRSEFGRSFGGLREVRIDLVRVANLKIVDPTTGLELTLDDIKFDGFKWLDGKLLSFGTLLVRSNQMVLDTVPSSRYPDEEFAQRFEGTIYSQMDRRLKADVPFNLDFALVNGKFQFESSLFGDAMQLSKSENSCFVEFVDFSPVDFVKVEGPEILPSNLNFKVDYGANFKHGPVSVVEGGSYQLGLTRFEKLHVNKDSELKKSTIMGTAMVNGSEVAAELYLDDHTPFWITVLSSPNSDSGRELWSQTVFGKSFAELDEMRQAAVTSMLVDRKPARTRKDSDSGEDANSADKAPDAPVDSVIEDGQKKEEPEIDANSEDANKSPAESNDEGDDGQAALLRYRATSDGLWEPLVSCLVVAQSALRSSTTR